MSNKLINKDIKKKEVVRYNLQSQPTFVYSTCQVFKGKIFHLKGLF